MDQYDDTWFIARSGDGVALVGRGGSGGPQDSLTLRIGTKEKTVRLRKDVPAELRQLVTAMDRLAGPKVWLGEPES